MPKKIALTSITVQRDGKTVIVAPETLFDFTDAELGDFATLEARHEEAQANNPVKIPFRAIVRDPVNESPAEAPVAEKKVAKGEL